MPDDERPDEAPAPRYRRERRPSVVDFEELEALKALTLPKGAAAPAPAPAAAEAPNIVLSRQGTRSTFRVPVETLVVEAQLELGSAAGDGDGDDEEDAAFSLPLLGAPLLDEHKAAFERQ